MALPCFWSCFCWADCRLTAAVRAPRRTVRLYSGTATQIIGRVVQRTVQVSLLPCLVLLLWLMSVVIVWRGQCAMPVRYTRSHRLRGGEARHPAIIAHGNRLRAATLQPAALIKVRHCNVAGDYCATSVIRTTRPVTATELLQYCWQY